MSEQYSGVCVTHGMRNLHLTRGSQAVALLVVFMLIFVSPAMAQEPLAIQRTGTAITFDGNPQEEAWNRAIPVKLTMHQPVFGSEPTEESVIRMLYDNDYFYLSAIFNYKDMSQLRAVSKKRDFVSLATDWFGIVLDSYGDRENGVTFWTNPNGLRTDGTIKNDAVSFSDDINFSWNTFWDSKAIINDHGWTAEVRIPFSSLRFQDRDGKTTMGIILERVCAAKPEISTYPPVSPEFNNAFFKPSLTAAIVFDGLKPKKPLYVTPYLTAGFSQTNTLNEAGTAYKMISTPKFDAGLDAKYSLTNNLTADITVNTDFAQVEADDEKINLTRFSLFFPEKRVFFQEKSDVFDFSFLDGNNLFYSRRIGIYQGNPERIYGGARLTGKVGSWDVGFLDMQTGPSADHASENYGVFRTRRTVFNKNSFVGGMLTTRIGIDGRYNVGYGIDGQFRVKGDDYLVLKMAQTYETGVESRLLDLSPTRMLFQWERRRIKGFSYEWMYTYSGTRFNPGVGFELLDNFQGVRGKLNYGWLPGESSVLRYHQVSASLFNIWSTETGLHETSNGIVKWQFEAKKGHSGSLSAVLNREILTDTLMLGNDQARVLPGSYTFANISSSFSTASSHALAADFTADAGQFYDGMLLSLSAAPRLEIGSGLSLSLTYRMDYVNFPTRKSAFVNHIAGLKGLLTLTTKTSLSAFIQYNTAVNRFVTNIRFRWNPREGNDFYIVYNEGLNTGLMREVPALPFSAGRTVLVKYTYTFRL